ncbi:MAG: serine/threonine protein kinase [Myxococcaceae bacterium]|nr:serine/threonine protein kinase [Myxococcaceae bacterium]
MAKDTEGKSAPRRGTRVSVSRAPLAGTPSRQALASWRPSARLEPVERYGRFEILGRIGRGGMAEILLARERSAAGGTRHLVIKRVLPEVRDFDEMLHMFLDETRIVMDLSHPNLCQIYEVGEKDGDWFIAMEWVNGVTLHQLSRRAVETSELDYGVIARVVSQCAEALHYAHTARDTEGELINLVHRDVSPHNVMIAYDGRVKLLDFGIAKSNATTHRTEAGVVKGKICYMAPEQWLSQPLDARTDVFALGATLYEGLCGRVAFKRENQLEVMKSALAGDVPKLTSVAPNVPATLVAIVERALATKPEHRYQSAREMSEALELFLASLSTPINAARIADYTRRAFRGEVQLGPVLERSMRGARFAHSEALCLPPLPPSLFKLANVSTGGRALPPPFAISAPPPQRFITDKRPWPEEGAFDNEIATERARLKSGTFHAVDEPLSEAPTRPTIPSMPELAVSTEVARPLARTLSMRVGRARHAMLGSVLALAAAVPMFFAARVLLDEQPGAIMVRTHDDATIGSPAPAFSSMPAGAALEVASRPDSEQREVASQAPYAGRLSINTRPWSTVYLGKRLLGSTPLADVPVPRGALNLKLVDRDGRVHIRRVPATKSKARSIHYEF